MGELIERSPENIRVQGKILENPRWGADEIERLQDTLDIEKCISKDTIERLMAVVEAAELYLFIERDGRGNDRSLAEKKLRDAIAAAKTDTR